jgi:hypothetical protein
VSDRTPAGAELVWDDFHETVNMTSDELRTWLLTDASGEEAFAADPDLNLPELGRRIVRLLGKRKVDLTSEDVEVMQRVVDFVAEQEANRPPAGAGDERWRRSLMTVGHDPLKP